MTSIVASRREVPATFRRRLVFSVAAVLVLFGLALVRLWHLEVTEGDQYRSLSENNRIRLKRVRATRGTILDRKGQILVDNRPSFDIALVPEDAHDVPRTIGKLASLLNADPHEFTGALQAAAHRPPFEDVILKRDIEWDNIVALETHQLELPGVSVQVGPRRTYPFNDMAAHLLGYVGEVSRKE